jgi:hypothetical protein
MKVEGGCEDAEKFGEDGAVGGEKIGSENNKTNVFCEFGKEGYETEQFPELVLEQPDLLHALADHIDIWLTQLGSTDWSEVILEIVGIS